MSQILEATEGADGQWAAIAPGLYPDLTNEEYQESDGVSKSWLDDISPEMGHTPAHFYDKRLAPDREERKKTPALIMGDAIHKRILEPDLFERRVAKVPDDAPPKPSSRSLKAKNPQAHVQDAISWWADFEAEHAGKMILPASDFDVAIKAGDSVLTHPVAKTLFTGGAAEQSYYAIDQETGALIKCRVDYEQLALHASVTDLKTTEDATPNAFASSAFNYRYDVQDVWYRHVIRSAWQGQVEVRRFVFVTVEKVRPFAVGVNWIDPADYAAAMQYARRDLDKILEGRATGIWPDNGCNPTKLRRLNRRPID